MLKRHNILPTRTNFFVSSAGKFGIMQGFNIVSLHMTVM